MKKGAFYWMKNAVLLGSAALCLWCGAGKLQEWAQTQGEEALLFAAGMEAQESPSPQAAPTASPDTQRVEELAYLLPDDGVVSLGQGLEEGVAATPDPNRNWAPVEETQISGGTQVGSFFVKDTTGSGTDLNAALQEEPSVHLKRDGSVEVLIYHTHTSEAYSRDFTGFYYTDMETRTGDPDQSVAAVGEEIKKVLEEAGIGAVHDTTVNDTLYNGSYARSWEVLQKNLAEHPGIQVTIDVHRDSMTTEAGTKYKPTAVINGKKAAQIMFLAGCDADGSWGDFPNWRQNLRLILRLQQTATRLYPDLVRPLSFSNSKYNMNATTGSLLVEVGTEVNTVEEAKYSGRLVGEILAETLQNGE